MHELLASKIAEFAEVEPQKILQAYQPKDEDGKEQPCVTGGRGDSVRSWVAAGGVEWLR